MRTNIEQCLEGVGQVVPSQDADCWLGGVGGVTGVGGGGFMDPKHVCVLVGVKVPKSPNLVCACVGW